MSQRFSEIWPFGASLANQTQGRSNILINPILVSLVHATGDRHMARVVVHGLLHPVGVIGDLTHPEHSHHGQAVTIEGLLHILFLFPINLNAIHKVWSDTVNLICLKHLFPT